MSNTNTCNLGFHAAADLFPLMAEEELGELRQDIAAHGLREPVVLCEGKILDGRNRYLACQKLGISSETREFDAAVEGDPFDYVLSANLHRRHLTAQQRREVAAKLLKEDPTKSDRRVAEQVKTDHKTVGAVRAGLERRGEFPHVAGLKSPGSP